MTAAVFTRIWMFLHLDNDRAASLIEYALLVGLIAIVALGAVAVLGSTTAALYSEANSQLG